MLLSRIKLLSIVLVLAVAGCSAEDDDDNGGGGGGGGGGNTPSNSFVSCGGYDYIEDVPERTYEGVLCISDFLVEEGNADLKYEKIEYKYYFSTFFGEGLHRGSIRWNGNLGGNEVNIITIRAQVYDLNGDFTGYYYFYSPIFGDSENEWSYDVSGSPAWDEFFTSDADGNNYISEQTTKDLFLSGFYLDNLYPYKINDTKYYYE